MDEQLEVSVHAKVRYKERVEPGVSWRVAQGKILGMLAVAELKPEGEITRYYYPSEESPEWVMVVKGGTVLTVVKPNEIKS